MDRKCRTGLFPLPTLLCKPPPPRSRSARVKQRFKDFRDTVRIANLSISALNFLASANSPISPPFLFRPPDVASSHLFPPSSTSNKSLILRNIFASASAFHKARPSGTCDSAEQFHFGAYTASSSIVPLTPDAVALPQAAASVCLIDLLPAPLRSFYEDPAHVFTSIPPPNFGVRPLRTSYPDWVKLVRRLQALQMVDFTVDPKIVNGVFGIPKGDSQVRFILNAVPANKCCVTPPKAFLPDPSFLSRLFVTDSRPIAAAKLDLESFYHQLILPPSYAPYFAMPSVRASDVGLDSVYGPDALVFPCLRTLPMGWSHSVFLAQAVNEFVIYSHAGLSPHDSLKSGVDFALDRVRHDAFIDDLFLIGPLSPELRSQFDALQAAYARVGLPVNVKKVIPPTLDPISFLGVTFCGRSLSLYVDPVKLWRLVQQTVDVLYSGFCSGVALSRLVGSWTWAALICRPALSVFRRCYRFIGVARARVFSIWPSVSEELWAMVGLAPLLVQRLNAPFFPTVLACDASSLGMGVCSHDTDSTSVQSLTPFPQRHDMGSIVSQPSPALRACLTSGRWRTLFASPWRFTAPSINSLEAIAAGSAIKWLCSRKGSCGVRALLLSDSQVVSFALRKGRSSSPFLVRPIRVIAAFLLALGVQLFVRWIPTLLNPADAPSRTFL
jgi:hypothetical protein